MIFATLENGRLAVVIDDKVVDVPAAAAVLKTKAPADTLLDLVRAGDDAAREAHDLASKAAVKAIATTPRNAVRLAAPLPHPVRDIICLGKNYRDHAKEVAGKLDKEPELPPAPIFFTKATTTVIGPDAPIPAHAAVTSKLDYEAELALVIGRVARDVPREKAWEHVFGYTAFNDVSARDLQSRHAQWFRGKSLDGFGPLGPVLVHRSAMPAPCDIHVRCWVNDELRQDSTFDQLIFDVPEIIATLSAGSTLLPGDIIATGTPAGVAMGMNPPKYMKPGDRVAVEITGVGRLENPVV